MSQRIEDLIPTDQNGRTFSVLASKRPDGTWAYGQLDGTVEIEMDGTSVNQQRFTVTGGAGDVTIITPAAGKYLKIYRCVYTVSADLVGESLTKLATTVLDGVQNPKAGAMYGFTCSPNYVKGAVDAVMKINMPAGGNASVNVTWEEA